MKINKGFTLIELLVVIGIIAILSAVVLVAVNPGRQFAQSRDTQRQSDLYSITNALYQFSAEHEGDLPTLVDGTEISDDPENPSIIGSTNFDLASAGSVEGGVVSEPIVPTYIASMPSDPSIGTEENSGYSIYINENNRLVVTATGELKDTIQITR